jgi:glutamate dehydrogenase (NADP+)
MSDILKMVKTRDPGENEFHQAVQNMIRSVKPVLDRNPEYRQKAVMERITEPERVITFRVPWMDDQADIKVNRGFSIEMNSALGPYKGGLRFHPSVNQSILKFLAFEQVFKNAHIGPETDTPAGDIGVGAREIGYLFGMYRKLRNEFTGVLTGKGLGWGGSLIRLEATGYGCVYFAAEMLAIRNNTLEGKTCLVSGSGKVAQFITEKLIELGANILTLSDSSGYIYDEEGINRDKLEFVKQLKNVKRGRISEYADKYPRAVYTDADKTLDYNPLWNHPANCAFPAATENEIREKDAYNLINNRISVVCEGANMPCTAEAAEIIQGKGDILYAPGKAANAGGAAAAGLEMVQNSMRLSWTRQEIDNRLKIIIKDIHKTCLDAAGQYGTPGNYVNGANITGFVKVVEAMLDQGVV